MAAGKTYQLMNTVQNLLGAECPSQYEYNANSKFQFKQVLLCKPNLDSRSGKTSIVSRNGMAFHGVDSLDNLDSVVQKIVPSTLTVVDEAQFFDESLLRLYRKCSTTAGCTLVVSGLDLDFQGKPFGHVLALANEILRGPASGSIHMLRAPCYVDGCERPAAFSKRIVESDSQIFIGGSESYVPACNFHHNDYDTENTGG